jgi:GNAT superfamily N-acetyltransferase
MSATSSSAPARSVIVPGSPAIPGLTFRTGRIPEDWTALADLVSAVRAADGVEERPTGEYLAADWGNLEGWDGGRDLVLAELDGRVVAFATGVARPRDGVLALDTWGGVHPDVRRRGLGRALHRWIRGHWADRTEDHPLVATRQFRTYALDQEVGDIALFEAEGFVPIRYGFEMRRPITGSLPEHPLPPGLELRPVRDDDVRTILRGEDEAFQDHWGHHPMTEDDIRAVLEFPETDTSLWQVAWDGDQVAGVVQNAIYRVENERLGLRRGWLDRVSVRRPWRGRGLAKALCAASFRVLREHGMTEAWLGVDASNPTGALQLYEGLGFHVSRRWAAFGRPLEGPAPAGWTGEATPPADADDHGDHR